jgi:hypothetical protein
MDTELYADKTDDNTWELDVSIPIEEGSDKIVFMAKRRFVDPDADAVFAKALNVSPLSGIAVTDGPNGKFQVQADKEDLEDVDDRALLFECKVIPASSDRATSIARGVIYVRQSVVQSTP